MNQTIIDRQRKKLNLSAESIASYVNVSVPTLYRWMRGEVNKIPANKVEKLANILKIPNKMLIENQKHLVKPILRDIPEDFDDIRESYIVGYEEVAGNEPDLGDYFLYVHDSNLQHPRIFNGDLVLIKKATEASSEDNVLVKINGKVSVRKIFYIHDLMIVEATTPHEETYYLTKEEQKDFPMEIIGILAFVKTRF